MTARRLSLLDSNFLQLETARQPMHVAGLMIFELPANAKADFVNDVVERFRNCTVYHNPWNYRLKRTGRLQFMPLLEEVHSIDMEYHVRHLALPRPGGERQLGQMIARLHSQPLDLRRPMWEVHLIEGLENNRFALYLKIHHCLVDGVSATKILMRALSTMQDDVSQLPFWAVTDDSAKDIPRAQLNAERNKSSLPKASSFFAISRAVAHSWFVKGDDEDITMRTAPRSIINDRIYTQRRFATHSEPLDRIKAIAKGADASLNDIVVALSGAVLREYLEAHNALPERGLTASIPVSLHDPNDKSIKNNIGFIFATTGTHIADDRRRVDAIKASVQKAKERMQALPKGSQGMFASISMLPYIGGLVTGLAGRIKPSFNVVISNVPGPKEPRYLFGARLTNLYPVSIPMHGGALNITCFSHAGVLNFGLTACRDSLPHMQQMAVSLGRAVDRYEELYCGKVTPIRAASGSN